MSLSDLKEGQKYEVRCKRCGHYQVREKGEKYFQTCKRTAPDGSVCEGELEYVGEVKE